MRRYIHVFLFLLMALLFPLASCSPGHVGTNVIAFIRDGHLWTIDPDGANAFTVAAQNTPIVGYTWSPNHQLLAFRALDPDFARTQAGKQISTHPITGQVGDAASSVNTIGVDGGSPITIAFSSPDVRYSNATWSTNNARLLYRQTGTTPPSSPDSIRWWVSQNDQPGGIAIKSLPGSYSIPAISYDVNNALVVGNSGHGLFTTTLTGTDERVLQREGLSGHPLPAALERILWQPAHQNASMLYAVPLSSPPGKPLQVQLVQRTLNGQVSQLASCACTQFAWSPDGNYVLYGTAAAYTILRLSDRSTFDIEGVADSVPYWSPDSRFLLLDGPHSLRLVQVASRQQTVLLSDGSSSSQPETVVPSTATNTL
ncbi:MAG: hypothetical protein J2P37_28080, partial [Ktedonobacteraceae bacterium]|nr:hypothetical protein [Ktedonobacteraceae bacterium]